MMDVCLPSGFFNAISISKPSIENRAMSPGSKLMLCINTSEEYGMCKQVLSSMFKLEEIS